MFGPPPAIACASATTDLVVEVERDLTILRRGSEVRRRQGDRDGMGQSQRLSKDVADTVNTNALRDRLVGHRQVRHRDQGRQDCELGKAAIPTYSPRSTS
jgi:urease subunit alpha